MFKCAIKVQSIKYSGRNFETLLRESLIIEGVVHIDYIMTCSAFIILVLLKYHLCIPTTEDFQYKISDLQNGTLRREL